MKPLVIILYHNLMRGSIIEEVRQKHQNEFGSDVTVVVLDGKVKAVNILAFDLEKNIMLINKEES
jgi:hypothetical protein